MEKAIREYSLEAIRFFKKIKREGYEILPCSKTSDGHGIQFGMLNGEKKLLIHSRDFSDEHNKHVVVTFCVINIETKEEIFRDASFQ